MVTTDSVVEMEKTWNITTKSRVRQVHFVLPFQLYLAHSSPHFLRHLTVAPAPRLGRSESVLNPHGPSAPCLPWAVVPPAVRFLVWLSLLPAVDPPPAFPTLRVHRGLPAPVPLG